MPTIDEVTCPRSDPMTIGEARQWVKQLEQSLVSQLRAFEKASGLHVQGITVEAADFAYLTGGTVLRGVQSVTVQVSLR